VAGALSAVPNRKNLTIEEAREAATKVWLASPVKEA
jgi:hypothetical protein